MKLIDGDNLIEHAEVNCESADFVEKLIDYVSEQEEVSISQGHDEDLVSRQAAIDAAVRAAIDWHRLANPQYSIAYCIGEAMRGLPSAQSEIIRCKDCKWWNKSEDSPFGYCMAMKHGYMSTNWEIGIYRRYKGDFYCADAEADMRGEE